jgi:D-aminopeptidase
MGDIETPILLTSTTSVPRVADALISYMLALPGNEEVLSINPLVGETNNGYLNDIRGRQITQDDVFAAMKDAKGGPVEEGSVGAGTGTVLFGFKGGIGTSSRRLPAKLGGHTVGVLVQTNFGGVLTIAGVPVGRELGRYYLREELQQEGSATDRGNGSVMIVSATDAPMDAEAFGGEGDVRSGAHRKCGLERQWGLCHRVLHCTASANTNRRKDAVPAHRGAVE